MRRKLAAVLVAASVSVLSVPAAGWAHLLVVSPPGQGDGGAHHVGQAPAAGHNSCFGHMTASGSEQSGAVTFLGPPVCPPR